MADEALAPSSLTIEAATPGEADYTAIHDVFMETARGRWFLAEFAKRNRNADTRMVLDAVARIEQSLAGAKDAPADLSEAFAAIRHIVEEAKQQAAATLQGQPSAARFATAYRSVRAVREVAWMLRESGSDSSVCDGLDAQANTIDRSLDQLAAIAPGDTVEAIFNDLIRRLEDLAGGELPSIPAPTPTPSPRQQSQPPASPPPPATDHHEARTVSEAPVPQQYLVPDTAPPMALADEPDLATETFAVSEPAASIEAITADESDVPDLEPAMVASAMNEAAIAAADEAHDIAVLDMIAMEMAADDPEVADDALDDGDEPTEADIDVIANSATLDEAFDLRRDSPASLGAALIANGTIRPRSLTDANRFASIQRLSQAEKIALFS
ncbi:MAG: hypothetical protein J0H71_13085 [Rhizobiales bacterium]|nr:hypothetical protein [Hyphomicrobiales bacterium]